MKQIRLFALVLSFALCCSGIAVGRGKPSQPIKKSASEARHPNLAAAQHDIEEAYSKIVAAEKANEFDSDGHAQKAKDLVVEANQELDRAAAKVVAAQKADEFDPNGHAQKAKELIDQANQELNQALQESSKH